MKVQACNSSLLLSKIAIFQQDIDVLNGVAKSWGLFLHPYQCVSLRFGKGLTLPEPYNHYYIGNNSIPLTDLSKDLGILVDTKLRFHNHIQSMAAKASGVSSNLLKSIVCRSQDFMKSLYISHIRPLLGYSSVVWNTGYIGGTKLLESIQRRWTRNIEGLENLSYGKRLQSFGTYSLCMVGY